MHTFVLLFVLVGKSNSMVNIPGFSSLNECENAFVKIQKSLDMKLNNYDLIINGVYIEDKHICLEVK